MGQDLRQRLRGERTIRSDRGGTLAREKLAERRLPSPQGLFRPGRRRAMVFPLVVLVAVLPGMAALNSWDLTPPGPMWGLRGLAVLDGLVLDQTDAAALIKPVHEAAAFRAVAYQPPLYAWLEAIAFALTSERNPIGSILPSYLAGAAPYCWFTCMAVCGGEPD